MAGAFTEFPFSTDDASSALPIVSFSILPPVSVFGGLSADDLLDLWKSVTDPSYHLPILETPNGGGDEIRAVLAIHAAAARAVESSTQSLYILPWSGQTSDPARTAAIATGVLEISRIPTPLFPAWIPVVWSVDQFSVDHVGIDWSPEGPLEVLTGRRYLLTEASSLGPGDLGPHLYPARAERAGSSYNTPGPDTIRRPVQAGAGLNNVALSTSAPSPSVNWLVLAPFPDLLSAAQIGQYVRLAAPPAVAGQVRRLKAYTPPVDSSTGGTVLLDTIGIFTATSVVGTFQLNEEVYQASTGARGFLVAAANSHFALEQFIGAPFAPGAVVGSFTGATATLSGVVRECALPAASSVAWSVLDWELDVGLVVTNPAPFTGGRLPVLEELGAERNVFISSGESEETYRRRVASAADVVSPNALLRAANRLLSPYGSSACLREVGSPKLRGLFFDVEPDANPDHAFAFDMDGDLRAGDRWKVLLDYTESRAFFLMGIPSLGLNDFSSYADSDPGADASDAFFDGYAITDSFLNSAIYSTLVRAKAGGVGFELFVETDGCA